MNFPLAFLALTVCSLAGCSRQPTVQAKQDSSPIAIRATPVAMKQLQRDVESVGTLFPYEEVTISSEIDGRVVEVGADLGDRVTKGQPLVRVSDEEQRYLVAQNEAQLRQSLERLGLTNETDRVTDIKATPEVRRAQADLTDAQQRYARARTLVDEGIGPRQDLDQAQAHFQAMQAAYDTSLNQTRNLIQEIQRTRAALDLQRKKLRDTTIFTPEAGHVKERLVNVGQYLRPNTPVFTLVKIDPIRLRIEVPERMAPWVKTGQFADVMLEAYPNRGFRGKIWRISPTVEQSKRTFIVEALIENPDALLKPGSYAKARIRTDKIDSIKLVPTLSINYVFGSNKVYIVKDNLIEAREVKIGDRFGSDTEIIEGVQDGDQVATSQVPRLDTGVKVRIEK
jgi:RND family efflux transporter MFP subunit